MGVELAFQLRTLGDRFSRLRSIKDLYNVLRWAARGYAYPLPAYLKRTIVLQEATDFGAVNLVETGTFFGDTVAACAPFFEKIVSIEQSVVFARLAAKRFSARKNIAILCGDSSMLLPDVVEHLSGRTCFWLDAHYQGVADAGCCNPILKEITTIISRSKSEFYILIDDARYFGKQPDYPAVEDIKRLVGDSTALRISEDIIRIQVL